MEKIEARLLKEEQVECPLTHRFEPGMYIREIFMPKGTVVIGHEHLTEHWNIVITGRALVSCEQELVMIEAPHCFKSAPGVRKVLRILEDMIWQTLHPTNETDIDKLEKLLIVKSKTFENYKAIEALFVNERLT